MTARASIRVLIADDHYVVRMGLAAVMEYDPALTVVAMAEDGQAAVTLYRQHRPDVTLMDVRMPVLDGIEATRRIVALDPSAQVLMLSTLGGERDVRDALAAGARGYVLKTAGLDDLRAAILSALRGQPWLSA
jgi:two-component system NarL family response regulator